MALCQYCGRVEIAWHQGSNRRWVAYQAARNEHGEVLRREERNGGRTVRRPVADLNKRHYPPANSSQRTETECEEWTAQKASERKRGGKRTETLLPPLPSPTPLLPLPLPWQVWTPEPPPSAPAPDVIRSQVRSEMITILDEYGIKPPSQEIIVQRPDGMEIRIDGPTHEQVPQLLRLIGRGLHVYMYGAAGGGKTHAACQALQAVCGHAAVITMPGITAGKLFGFTDAGGRYVHTAFVDAYTSGGGIVLDELDRALPQVASALNSVLENRRATFNGEEVQMHENFRLVATGNTDMRGANRTYTGAQPQDLATAARFRFMVWRYDNKLESALTSAVIPESAAAALLTWVRRLRAQLEQDRHDTVFAGPRETMRIAAGLAAGETLEDEVEGWIFRGLTRETVTRLLQVCPLPEIPQQVRQ